MGLATHFEGACAPERLQSEPILFPSASLQSLTAAFFTWLHLARASQKLTLLSSASLRLALSCNKRVRKWQVCVSLRGLKEQGNPIYDDLVEGSTKTDVALWAGENTRPAAIHCRNDSSLVFDQGLKQIRTGPTQISYVFSTRVDS